MPIQSLRQDRHPILQEVSDRRAQEMRELEQAAVARLNADAASGRPEVPAQNAPPVGNPRFGGSRVRELKVGAVEVGFAEPDVIGKGTALSEAIVSPQPEGIRQVRVRATGDGKVEASITPEAARNLRESYLRGASISPVAMRQIDELAAGGPEELTVRAWHDAPKSIGKINDLAPGKVAYAAPKVLLDDGIIDGLGTALDRQGGLFQVRLEKLPSGKVLVSVDDDAVQSLRHFDRKSRIKVATSPPELFARVQNLCRTGPTAYSVAQRQGAEKVIG